MEAWAVTRRAKMAMNRSCNFAIVLILTMAFLAMGALL